MHGLVSGTAPDADAEAGFGASLQDWTTSPASVHLRVSARLEARQPIAAGSASCLPAPDLTQVNDVETTHGETDRKDVQYVQTLSVRTPPWLSST